MTDIHKYLKEADERMKRKPQANPQAQTQVKDKSDTFTKFADPTSKGEVAVSQKPVTGITHKTASAAKTKLAVKPQDNAQAMAHMSDLDRALASLEMDFGDDDETPTENTVETKPENLPAVISKAVAEQGKTIDVEWHMVKNLPGMVQRVVRSMGRAVFAQFTDTPVDKIQVASTLSNTKEEVQAMMTWITRNGIQDDTANIDFSKVMPGYEAESQIWSTEGYAFMLVKDFMGYYIYGWPGGRGVKLSGEPPMKLIK